MCRDRFDRADLVDGEEMTGQPHFKVQAGQVGGPDYATSDNGWSYGVQMEVWW
jgi:hypothetical protein